MDDKRDRTLWCGNLDPRVTECLLYELFIQAGPLEDVTIPKDNGGRLRSYAFVTFKHPESVGYTLALMEGTTLFGRPLKLERRPDAAVDDTYIAMMARHAQYVDEVKRRRFQEMFSPMPSPFMTQWASQPPRSVYDQRFCFQNAAGSPIVDGKYSNRQHLSGRYVLPMPPPHDHRNKRSALTPGHPTRRREERHYDNAHRRRHTHDPYWRGRW